MRLASLSALFVAVGVLAAGCSSRPPTLGDDEGPVDAGTTPIDSGARDATTPRDAGRDAARDASKPPVDAAPGPRVLFVGNSYTYVNDLPSVLRELAHDTGSLPNLEVDSVTVGGATLQQLFDGGDVEKKLAATAFDYVVLQEQSYTPCLNLGYFLTGAIELADLARQYGATPVLYETWPRKAGDVLYTDPNNGVGDTPETMHTCLSDAYEEAGRQAAAKVAHVGDAWAWVVKARPSLDLYSADGSHPSPSGTFLAACVILSTATTVSSIGVSTFPSGVLPADGTYLEGVAAQY